MAVAFISSAPRPTFLPEQNRTESVTSRPNHVLECMSIPVQVCLLARRPCLARHAATHLELSLVAAACKAVLPQESLALRHCNSSPLRRSSSNSALSHRAATCNNLKLKTFLSFTESDG